jgi:hypothetical protein
MIKKTLFGLSTIALALLFWQLQHAPAPLKINLSEQDAKRVGEQIWQNEGASKIENLVVWNEGEDFPSLGLGHFIWFPKGVNSPFQESFPALLKHLKKTTQLPDWLNENSDAPWHSRNEFLQQINATRTLELRRLMHNSFAQQTQFIILRLQAALPKMLAALDDPQQQKHVRQQFERLLQQPAGVYALIDYVNFKGEGTAAKEKYKGQGWGLLQVLENMDPMAENQIAEFAKAADFVLTRRVENAPRDERRWLAGWRKRLTTYSNFRQDD